MCLIYDKQNERDEIKSARDRISSIKCKNGRY